MNAYDTRSGRCRTKQTVNMKKQKQDEERKRGEEKKEEERKGKGEKSGLGKKRSTEGLISRASREEGKRERGVCGREEVERQWAQKCTDGEQRAFGQPERIPGTQSGPGYRLQTNRPACGKETKDNPPKRLKMQSTHIKKKSKKKVWVSTEDRETMATSMETTDSGLWSDGASSGAVAAGWKRGKGQGRPGKGCPQGSTSDFVQKNWDEGKEGSQGQEKKRETTGCFLRRTEDDSGEDKEKTRRQDRRQDREQERGSPGARG